MSAPLPPIPAPSILLSPGVEMPQLGYGLYKVPAADAEAFAGLALDAGYRSLDTASMYGNEAGVGAAVRAAAERGIPRSEVFVTSKLWNDDQGYEATLRAFDRSMAALGLEVLDLYLIHWPCPERGLFLESYRAMETLLEQGRVRAIGVSNFQPTHLEALLTENDVPPAINQIELHPWLQQRELRKLHAQWGIRTEAWSPLARGRVLDDPLLEELAARRQVSVAQIVLRWQLQLGNLVIPKATSASRIAENARVFSFELSPEEMASIEGLDRGFRSGSHPDEVN